MNPTDTANAAHRIYEDLQKAPSWSDPSLRQLSLCLLEARLKDLAEFEGTPNSVSETKKLVIRNPTLLETTVVFPPVLDNKGKLFQADPSQILRRVRAHTHMGDKNAGLEEHVAAVGNPAHAPFAIFGLPPLRSAEKLRPFLNFTRFLKVGLDVVIVDVTRTGRSELPEDWEKSFSILLESLAMYPGRRPAVVVLAEDAFAMRRATRTLKAYSATHRVARRTVIEVGSYLPEAGLLGEKFEFPAHLPPLNFEADIKDASLAPLRQELLKIGQDLRRNGSGSAAAGASKALALLRRLACLPIGTAEAQDIARILYGGEDEVDVAARSLFLPKMELRDFAAAADISSHSDSIRKITNTIEEKVERWGVDTPVSAKLSQLLLSDEWNNPSAVISVPERRVVDLYLGSDRGVHLKCTVVDHRGLHRQFSHSTPKRLIVLGPSPEAIRVLLTVQNAPGRIVLLGDAAGSALLSAEILPLSRISAFAPLAQRAKALADALRRGGSEEQLDITEAEFRTAAVIPEGEIDFTQSGGSYKGDVVRIRTARNRVVYRPTSDVLVFSPSEARPFEKIQARDLQIGNMILVLDVRLREPLRRALAGSRTSLKQLTLYHDHIKRIHANTLGISLTEKVRRILIEMRKLDPKVDEHEAPNVARWLTAGEAQVSSTLPKQPRAARDWARFNLFMRAVGVEKSLAELYWTTAIVPSRSYRAQEGYQFNQRVVQFVLDPEGASIGAAAWDAMQGLWQKVLESVDKIEDVKLVKNGGASG